VRFVDRAANSCVNADKFACHLVCKGVSRVKLQLRLDRNPYNLTWVSFWSLSVFCLVVLT